MVGARDASCEKKRTRMARAWNYFKENMEGATRATVCTLAKLSSHTRT